MEGEGRKRQQADPEVDLRASPSCCGYLAISQGEGVMRVESFRHCLADPISGDTRRWCSQNDRLLLFPSSPSCPSLPALAPCYTGFPVPPSLAASLLVPAHSHGPKRSGLALGPLPAGCPMPRAP